MARRRQISTNDSWILDDAGRIIGVGTNSRTVETLFATNSNVPGEAINETAKGVTATPSGSGGVIKALAGDRGIRVCHARGAINSSQTGTGGVDLLLASVVIPGGAIGPHGRLFADMLLLAGAITANVKTIRFKLGGVLIGENTSALTSTRGARFEFNAFGAGDQANLLAITTSNATIAVAASGAGSGAVPGNVAIDHSIDQAFEVFVNLAQATDAVALKYWDVGTAFGG